MLFFDVFKIAVNHDWRGLQRFIKIGSASVECRAICQSNAVLCVSRMPWGVSRMPLPCQSNAVPLSAECRVSVSRMPCHRVNDRPKIASVECRAFCGILFAIQMALLTWSWDLFDLYRVLVDHKAFDNANVDQRVQGFAQPEFEVPKVLGNAST